MNYFLFLAVMEAPDVRTNLPFVDGMVTQMHPLCCVSSPDKINLHKRMVKFPPSYTVSMKNCFLKQNRFLLAIAISTRHMSRW